HTSISRDWSSDVCSSDLFVFEFLCLNPRTCRNGAGLHYITKKPLSRKEKQCCYSPFPRIWQALRGFKGLYHTDFELFYKLCKQRSEERRVGKECKYQWSP